MPESIRLSVATYPAERRQGWHRHDDAVVCLMLAGLARERVGGNDVVAGALQVGVKPPGLRHTDHFGPDGVRAIRVRIPADHADVLGRHAAPLWRWSWHERPALTRTLLRLAQGSGAPAPDATWDLMAALDEPVPARRPPPGWLRCVREYLGDSYRETVRLAGAASVAERHPMHVAREFRRYYGCSVGTYVRRLRVQAAAHGLAGSSDTLAAVAARSGFSDQAHLTRVFRSETGSTPARYRRLAPQ